MNIKHLLPLQRIIAKVDNDFNIDQSDWIPRVAAWTIDAMSQLKCTPYIWQKIKCDVVNRKVMLPNLVEANKIKVFDNKGCIIEHLGKSHVTPSLPNTQYGNDIDTKWTKEEIAIFTGDKDIQNRLLVGNICRDNSKNFVIVNDTILELNYDTDFVVVEMLAVATYYDEYFNEQVPYIYDNGLLLEAISWYCMMKMLQRGYKHQVFSLSGQEPVNPYIQWNKIKDSAAASVKIDLRRASSKNEGWNNFFYNFTFNPRR